jgi:hypothetical protein
LQEELPVSCISEIVCIGLERFLRSPRENIRNIASRKYATSAKITRKPTHHTGESRYPGGL